MAYLTAGLGEARVKWDGGKAGDVNEDGISYGTPESEAAAIIAARAAAAKQTQAPAPAGATVIPGGYAIPAVIAAPATTVSPLIAAIPSGGTTEIFDYGAPTGAPTEEYGDAAEPAAATPTPVASDKTPYVVGGAVLAVLGLAYLMTRGRR